MKTNKRLKKQVGTFQSLGHTNSTAYPSELLEEWNEKSSCQLRPVLAREELAPVAELGQLNSILHVCKFCVHVFGAPNALQHLVIAYLPSREMQDIQKTHQLQAQSAERTMTLCVRKMITI